MVSQPTPSLQFEIPGPGDYRGSWDEVMQRLLTQIDKSIAGATTITTTGGTIDLTDTPYVDNQTRQSTITVAGALVSDVIVRVPARSKRYVLINKATGGKNVTIKTPAGDPVAFPVAGSAGEIRVDSDGSIMAIGPYVDRATRAITSTSYALQASLNAEVDRASAEEATLVKKDGSRAFTAPVGGVAPTANAHLATKQYVDNAAGLQDNIYVTTGTSAAYVVTTGGSLALFDGLAISVRLHATNAKDCTLNVDGNGAKPVRGFTGKTLPAGVGIAGSPYRMIYIAATQEWLFSGFFNNPYQVPIGGFLPFCSLAVPNSNFILPFGQALSRVTYADFYNLVGTAFGPGDGATTFNAPDLRGRAIFGIDNMGGAAAGRITTADGGIDGTVIGANGGAQQVTIVRSDLPNITLDTDNSGNHTHPYVRYSQLQSVEAGTGSNNKWGATQSDNTGAAGNHTHTTESINGGVTQTAMKNLPPAIMLPMLLRVI